MVIYTDKGYLDTYEGIKYPFNYAIGDVRDITKRNIDFSKTLKLPASKNNNKFFEYYYNVNVQSGSFDVNKKEFITVEEDGVEVFKGFLQLLSVNVNQDNTYYEAVVFSSFRNILDIVEGLDLNDLDFSEYNHPYTEASFFASQESPRRNYRYYNEGGSLTNVDDGYGYTYPYISYDGTLTQDKPAFFVREYIDKIFLLAGFKVESKLFDTNYFKSLILPFTNGILGFTQQEAEDLNVSYSEDSELYSVNPSNNFVLNEVFDLVTSELINDTTPPQFNTSNNTFTSNRNGKYNITVNTDITLFFESGFTTWQRMPINENQKIQIVLTINNDPLRQIQEDTFLDVSSFPFLSTNQSFTYSYTSPSITFENIELEEDDEVKLKILAGGQFYNEVGAFGSPDNLGYDLTLTNTVLEYKISSDAEIELGDDLDVSKALPKFKITDFLKSIITMFNLYIYPKDGYDNTLIIESRDEFYSGNKTHFWKDRLDLEKGYKVSTLSEESAKTYLYKYKEGKDYINKEYKANNDGKLYAQKEVVTENQFLTNTQSYTSSFTATGSTIINSILTPVIYDRELNEETVAITDDYTNKPIKSEPRILFYGGGRFAGSREKRNYPTFSLDFETMKYTEDEAWQPYFDLYNLFHKNTIEEVSSSDAKLLTCYLKFNVSEIFIGDKIYILDEYWRINKIIDYDANSKDSTKVELFKLRGNVNYLTAERVIEQEEANTGLFNNQFNEKFD